jgi:hypothetical protein
MKIRTCRVSRSATSGPMSDRYFYDIQLTFPVYGEGGEGGERRP